MEHVRLLLAIGLSFIVLFVWSMFFVDKTPVQELPTKESSQETQVQAKTPVTPEIDKRPADHPADMAAEIAPTMSDAAVRQVTVETPYYSVRISTQGASFTSFVLKKYRETVAKDSPYKELIPPSFKDGIMRTSMADNSIPGLTNAVFTSEYGGDRLIVGEKKAQLRFQWISDDGQRVTKTYGFDPKSYLIDLDVNIQNGASGMLKDSLVLSMREPVEKSSGYGFVGPSALIDDSLEQVKTKKIEDKSVYKGNIKWIGIEDRYFLTSIIPESQVESSMKLSLNGDIVTSQLVNPEFQMDPGGQKTFRFLVFMGPKSMELLNSLGHGLGKALNFGFFDIIAKPCLWFMNRIYDVIPNYGIAIIILTVFTKIILWPLGTKSYRSMNEMKKLQPLMTEIREKYKDDKQKMNQELMALYRTYKVNPMGGCLPMVLQIPVFFALYRMLYQAIELRHAPFVFWINDLSAPDRLFHFSFSIPFMQPPYGIPVLTIIMGATMLLQQKMSPPPGDPTQAKMMMLMPVVFTFIFINFSSGLVLYWLVNNILSISQQYYVQRKAKS